MSAVLPIMQDTTIVAAGPSVQNVSLTGAVPVGDRRGCRPLDQDAVMGLSGDLVGKMFRLLPCPHHRRFLLAYIALGLAGFFLRVVHKTALIPAVIGVVLLVLGLLGGQGEPAHARDARGPAHPVCVPGHRAWAWRKLPAAFTAPRNASAVAYARAATAVPRGVPLHGSGPSFAGRARSA